MLSPRICGSNYLETWDLDEMRSILFEADGIFVKSTRPFGYFIYNPQNKDGINHLLIIVVLDLST